MQVDKQASTSGDPMGLFRLQKAVIPVKHTGQVFTLIPFGDIHRDSPGFANAEWEAFKERAKKAPNPIFLGMGDYMDAFSMSERRIIFGNELHESTTANVEKDAKKKIRELCEELSFARGKTIGILCGNHFVQYSDGTTGDMQIANYLRAPFLGQCVGIRLVFQYTNNGKATLDIFAHHGRGSGRTTTGRMASVEQMQATAEADIFLMGDNHARGVLPLGDKLRMIESKGKLFIRSRRAWIGRTGGFLKGYEPDTTSYIVRKQLPPTSLGWIEFEITFVRTYHGYRGKRSNLTLQVRANQ